MHDTIPLDKLKENSTNKPALPYITISMSLEYIKYSLESL